MINLEKASEGEKVEDIKNYLLVSLSQGGQTETKEKRRGRGEKYIAFGSPRNDLYGP